MANLTGLESFIFTNLKKMPTAVRVLTYLILLLLYVYSFIAPKVVFGSIDAVDSLKQKIPYSGQPISFKIQGNVYEVRTNSDGDWSIPVVNSIMPIYIRVLNINTSEKLTFTISQMDIWRSSFFNIPLMLRISENSVEKINVAMMPFSQSLYAQELLLPDSIRNTSNIKISKQDIANEINNFLLKYPWKTVFDKDTNLRNIVGVKEIDILSLYNYVQKTYGIEIPIDHWNSITTINQLAEYVYNRLVFLEYLKSEKIELPKNYYDQVELIPRNIRPAFKF